MKSDRALQNLFVAAAFIAACTDPVVAQKPGTIKESDPDETTGYLTDEAERHRAILLDGVQSIEWFGAVGDLSVFGLNAIPVVVAETESTEERAPVIAAAKLGRGRLVALAHDEFLEFKGGDGGGPDRALRQRLLSNLIRWSAGAEAAWAKPLRTLRIAVRGRWGMTDWLVSEKTEVLTLPRDDWSTTLKNVDVVVTGVFDDLTDEQIALLDEFVRDGGGVVAAGPGWAWRSYRAKPGESLPEDHTGNRLFAQAGIVWGDGTVRTPQFNELHLRPPPPEANARVALEVLLSRREQRNTPGDNHDSSALVATIARALNQIPRNDQLLRPSVHEYLATNPGELALPSHKHPLRLSDAAAWLAVSVQAARLKALPPEEVVAHPASTLFPGSVPDNAARVRATVAIDTDIPDWHSTGLYAAPGDLIRIQIPEAALSAGLKVRIGCHKDTLWHKGEWRRFPEVSLEQPLAASVTKVASAFGGPVYIVVPRDRKQGTINVEFMNVVRAPHFVLGKTDVSDWRFSIRHFSAPWAELETDRIILTVPSEDIRELDYPDRLVQWWNRVLDAQADLRAISRQRERPERIVVDRQISAGYLHAGYPIMGHYHHGAEAVDLSTLESKGNWGFYHELGHNHQHADWTYNGMGEVTVNLFSLYCYHTINPGVPVHAAVRPEEVTKKIAGFRRGDRKGDPFLELIPYMQMQEAFGWDAYKKVFAEYEALPPEQRPQNDHEKRDQWLIRMSRATGRNLTRFFDFWKIETSRRAKESVASLPTWFPDELENSAAIIDLNRPDVIVTEKDSERKVERFHTGIAGWRTEITGSLRNANPPKFRGSVIVKVIHRRKNARPLIMQSGGSNNARLHNTGEVTFNLWMNLPDRKGDYDLVISSSKSKLFEGRLLLR